MSLQPPEAGIPVLTEILPAPIYGVDVPERRGAPVPLPPPVTDIEPLILEQPVVTAILLDRARIAQELHETVMRDLLERVDLLLEDRIRDTLADVLQTAVDGLACELRHGLKETLSRTVAQAVQEATARVLDAAGEPAPQAPKPILPKT